jgi:hypothetical protein
MLLKTSQQREARTMGKSNAAANVIDLDSFRQRRMSRELRAAEPVTSTMSPAPVLVPVWFCWVPVWTPMIG